MAINDRSEKCDPPTTAAPRNGMDEIAVAKELKKDSWLKKFLFQQIEQVQAAAVHVFALCARRETLIEGKSIHA